MKHVGIGLFSVNAIFLGINLDDAVRGNGSVILNTALVALGVVALGCANSFAPA